MHKIAIATLALIALAAASGAHAVSLTQAGITQNFDGMGVAGTAPPADWKIWVGESGTSNSTWTSSITANGASGSVSSMIAATGALTVSSAPTATNNNGYNAAFNASTLADRVLATSPTTVSGSAIEVMLTNDTGTALNGLLIGYDTVRFTAASSANQLPGYQFFYSLDGNSWANVAAMNPSLATVPNTVGVSTVSNGVVTFSSPLAAGGTLLLRWVDDNAVQTSPDQIIGLNNVTISAVPEPGAMGMLLAGLAFIGVLGRRRRTA